jgi:hypothetical protein
MLLKKYITNRIINEARGGLDIDKEFVSDILRSFFVFNFMMYRLNNKYVFNHKGLNKKLVVWLNDHYDKHFDDNADDRIGYSPSRGDDSYFWYDIQNDDEVQNRIFLSAKPWKTKQIKEKIIFDFKDRVTRKVGDRTVADYQNNAGDKDFIKQRTIDKVEKPQKIHYAGLIRIVVDIESLFMKYFYSTTGLEDLENVIEGKSLSYFGSLKHELIHHNQYFNQKRLENKNYGFHAKKKRYTGAEVQIPHVRDIEFWPMLSSEKSRLLQSFNNSPIHFINIKGCKDDVNRIFLRYVRSREFFKELKKYSPIKYKKAVKELYDAFFKEKDVLDYLKTNKIQYNVLSPDYKDKVIRDKVFEFISILFTKHVEYSFALADEIEHEYHKSGSLRPSINFNVFDKIVRASDTLAKIEDKDEFKKYVDETICSDPMIFYVILYENAEEDDYTIDLSKEDVIRLLARV